MAGANISIFSYQVHYPRLPTQVRGPVFRRTWILLVCLFCHSPIGSIHSEPSDLALLLNGVDEIAAPGIPGPVSIFGEKAFPVIVGGYGSSFAPVVGAARMEKGRIVALGHNGFFGGGALKVGQTGKLVLNAIHWLGSGKPKKKTGPSLAVVDNAGFLVWLKARKVNAQELSAAQLVEKLKAFDVLFASTASVSGQQEKAIDEFVRAGGGLLHGVPGWGWQQLNRGKSLLNDHPGNRIMSAAGLVFADGYLKRTTQNGYTSATPPSRYTHAGWALDALVAFKSETGKLDEQQLSQCAVTTMIACRSVPPGDTLIRPRFRELFESSEGSPFPSSKKPLTAKKHPLERLALTYWFENSRKLRPEQIKAHPAATEFPGAIPEDAETVSKTIDINTNVPNWHSTGLYAPAGKVITVDVPESAAGKGLRVRIGCHRDSLWGKDSWRRVPQITNSYPIRQTATKAASAFGGLVYIEVPGKCELDSVSVKIAGAVEAPYYVLGKTDLKEWKESIRTRPAPWAELAGRKIIYSVPSSSIRRLDDPESLMKIWDDVLDAIADLAVISRQRRRPERFVTDVQISAGYMHSGYPIMAHLDAVYSVDPERAKKGFWGNYHELGHNHQSRDWTFGGTGEVTCNLFTLYAFEKVCGIAPKDHPRVGGSRGAAMIRKYFVAGPNFENWKRQPFTALMMYVQLQKAFGWAAYKKVFAEYKKLSPEERPKNDDQRRDQWMVRFSRTAGKNLGPFFEAWNVPTSEDARKSITDLPVWMPAKFPPRAKTSYIKEWRLSPVTFPWDRETYVSIGDKELKEIISSVSDKKPFRSTTSKIDLLPLFPAEKREDIAAYLVRGFESDAAREVKIYTGSDDALRLWLNGKLIHQVLKLRPVDYDSEFCKAEIKAGENTLVAEVSNAGVGWGFCIRLEDDKGNELEVTRVGKIVEVSRQ